MPKPSDADRVRALARKHPDWTVAQLAERSGVIYQRVQSALRSAGGKRGRRRAAKVGATLEQAEARREKLLALVPGKGPLSRINALRLVAVLLARPAGATVAELLDEIGCSRATLYRYRDDCIQAGLPIPIETEIGHAGAWRLVVPEASTPATGRGRMGGQ